MNQRLLLYRCYKKYDHNFFSKEPQNKISQPDLSFKQFLEIFQPMLAAFALYAQKEKRLDITEKILIKNHGKVKIA